MKGEVLSNISCYWMRESVFPSLEICGYVFNGCLFYIVEHLFYFIERDLVWGHGNTSLTDFRDAHYIPCVLGSG